MEAVGRFPNGDIDEMTAIALVGRIITNDRPSDEWKIRLAFGFTEVLADETFSVFNRVRRLPSGDKLSFHAFADFPVNETNDHDGLLYMCRNLDIAFPNREVVTAVGGRERNLLSFIEFIPFAIQ